MKEKFTLANIVKAILALATIFGVGAQGFVAQGDANVANQKADKAYELLRDVVLEQGDRIQELEKLLMRGNPRPAQSGSAPADTAAQRKAALPLSLEE
jgi:hypothetical protein